MKRWQTWIIAPALLAALGVANGVGCGVETGAPSPEDVLMSEPEDVAEATSALASMCSSEPACPEGTSNTTCALPLLMPPPADLGRLGKTVALPVLSMVRARKTAPIEKRIASI